VTDAEERKRIQTIGSYQFGAGAGELLFPPAESITIAHSSAGRPQQVFAESGQRLVSLGMDGRFTLGLEGGRRLCAGLDGERNRVVVGEESEPFVRDGKNVFAKFVKAVDSAIRARDEVAVVSESDDGERAVIAAGRAELDATAMADFDTGVAVFVRDSVE